MNGPAVPAPGTAFPAMPQNASIRRSSLSEVNSQRITLVAERIANFARSADPPHIDTISHLCVSLSRGMDYALANDEIPEQAAKLPMIFKQVCRMKDSSVTAAAAIMALMVTVKHACKARWFSAEESQELLDLADELSRIFNTTEGISFEQANIVPTVAETMSRYYPQLKLGRILASIEIKPGFEACALDFHISRMMNSSALDRIRLLVTMKDNIDTSACIISPQKVNILLNGRGVLRRTIGCMDPGPQNPSLVNPCLRYGTNLLQAVGDFDGHYIVLIAFMSVISPSDLPAPPDYTEPSSVPIDSDAEVVEGPSKISLKCPISFSRIKEPAKGRLCKHLQCFDLSKYIEMNSKRPSWRCPHCNQSVCYLDIRIDRKMVKILQEVAKDVEDVVIHSDGSWEVTSGSGGHKDESNAKVSENLEESLEQQEAPGLSNELRNVYDLTEDDDGIITIDDYVSEDRKPVLHPDVQITSNFTNQFGPLVGGDPPEINRTSGPQAQILSSSGPSAMFPGSTDHNMRANNEPAGGTDTNMFGPFPPAPMSTDSATPVATREQQAFLGTGHQPSPLGSAQPPATNNLQLQEVGRARMLGTGFAGSSIPRNVSRTPTAIQALPAQTPESTSSMMSPGPFMNNSSGNNNHPSHTLLPPASASVGASTILRNLAQQQYISQSQLQQHSTLPPAAVSVGSGAMLRNMLQQQYSLPQLQQYSNQMRTPPSATQVPGPTFRANSGVQTPHPPQHTNHTLPQMVSMPPHLRSRAHVPQGGSTSNINQTTPTNQQYQHMTPMRQLPTSPIQMPASRPAPMAPRSTDSVRNNLADRRPTSASGGTVQTVSRTQDLIDLQSEQNWRPSGRMRGSLSGRAYSEALSQFMIRPTQSTPSPQGQQQQQQQQSNLSPMPSQSQLQALLASRNSHASQTNPSQNNG